MGYIASIFVMITIISNNEYKAWAEKAFRRSRWFQSSEHFHVCRRVEMSVEEALVDDKAGVPPVFAGGMRSSWWSFPSLVQMYNPQTNPIIVWPFLGASPAAELIASPFPQWLFSDARDSLGKLNEWFIEICVCHLWEVTLEGRDWDGDDARVEVRASVQGGSARYKVTKNALGDLPLIVWLQEAWLVLDPLDLRSGPNNCIWIKISTQRNRLGFI